MVAYFIMLLGNGLAIGPAARQAFPLWGILTTITHECTALCYLWLQYVPDTPALDGLFEALFS